MTVGTRNRSKEWRSVPYNRTHMHRAQLPPRPNYHFPCPPQHINYARAARGQTMPPLVVFPHNIYQPPPFQHFQARFPPVQMPKPNHLMNPPIGLLPPPPPPPVPSELAPIIVPPPTPNISLDQTFPLLQQTKDTPATLDCSLPLRPPPISEKANLPKFDSLYDKFDEMKKNSYSFMSKGKGNQSTGTQVKTAKQSVLKPDSPSLPTKPASEQDDCFAAAMQIFMQSYLPTSCFQCTTPTEDWSKEVKALFNGMESLGDMQNASAMWPDKITSEISSTDIQVHSATVEKPAEPSQAGRRTNEASKQQTVTIQKHLLEIKPSPYPSGSPVSSETSVKSAHSSDNDADDDVSSDSSGSTAAPGGTIGRRLPCKKKKSERDECARVRLSLDSGYQSSSTEGSNINGYQASSALDSDEASGDQRLPNEDANYIAPYLSALLEAPWLKYQKSVTSDDDTASISEIKKTLSEITTSGACSDTNSTSSGSSSYPKHKAWITNGILDMIAVRDRLYKRMKKQPEPEIVELYKKVRNMVVGMTRNAKRLHEKRLEHQTGRGYSSEKRNFRHYERRNRYQEYSRSWKPSH